MTSENTELEWQDLEKQFSQLEDIHKEYCRKVDDVKGIQRRVMDSIVHQRYSLKQLQDVLKRSEKNASEAEATRLREISQQIADRKNQFREMEDVLPHNNGIYLRIVLGSVNVSLLSKHDKYKYKEDYERFKLYVTCISLLLAVVLLFLWYRVTDAAFQFLLVWYYCTLTIREHILKVNGSRIKGWWIMHHFISTVSAGIILIWPDGYTYEKFRNQFVFFCIYISFVQLLQYYYQSGLMYRLRALGQRRNMDVTVEGFQSWMWKGLSFLLPFLVSGYMFQLYNSYVLYLLSHDPRCKEWQVICLSLLFFVLFLGNVWTTSLVITEKCLKRGYDEHKHVDESIAKKHVGEKSTTHTD